MRVLSINEAELPAAFRAQVVAASREAWPADPADAGSAVEAGHDPQLSPLAMLLLDGDVVVSALTVLSKGIEHLGRRYAASGLSAVVTPTRFRHRGYGERLVTAAHDALAAGGIDLGIFTCDRPLQAFYERAGWRVLPGTVVIGGTPEAPFPSDQAGFDKVTMGALFSARALAHATDFDNARIALHPGDVDKLW
ncbi:MAG TPA: GNAT family N-acetyltransferase [Mycobacteriales bacterium]|nr:GNAT family N-acetyltransferase [Mycobacteriales bacterium]